MRSYLCYLISLSLLLPYQASASIGTAAVETLSTAVEDGALSKLPEELAKLGASSVAQDVSAKGETVYKILSSEGKIVREFSTPKATPEALEAAKPSKVFAAIKGLSQAAGGATLNQIKRFPVEAFTFFMALGAVTTQDLIQNYNQNPMAYDELFEGQKDPITQIGFAAFMMANGAVTQPLAAISQSKKLHSFLPYLGMSVGMIASKIVGEVGHIPGLLQCAKSATFDQQACDTAYQNWQKFSFAEKGMQMMPGLTAMLVTTFIMGAAQTLGYKALLAAGSASAAVAVRVIALDVLISCNAAGATVRGIKIAFWGWQVLQLIGFLDTSNYLEVPLTHLWNTAVVLGPALVNERANLVGNSISGNLTGVAKSLEKFSDLMDKWRENNALDALVANNHWIGYLSQLSAEYNISKKFYSSFLNDLWLFKAHAQTPADHTNLLRTYPLYGVAGQDFQRIAPAKYFSLPGLVDSIEQDQIKTLNKVSVTIAEYLKSHGSAADRPFLEEIQNSFASNDLGKMSATLIKINQALNLTPSTSPYISARTTYSKTLLDYLHNLRELIGDPYPMNVPGQGYLRALSDYLQEQGLPDPFAKNMGATLTPNATEALITLMYSGPDANHDSLVDTTPTGFKAHFHPPKIISAEKYENYDTPQVMNANEITPNDIFHSRYTLDQKWLQSADMQTNLFQGILKTDIQPQIFGNATTANVDTWWSQKVEPQYINAWSDFESKYQEIVQMLYKDLWRAEDDRTNFTGLSNGIVLSTRQELQVYLNFLENFAPVVHDYVGVKKQLDQAENNLENLLKGIRIDKATLISRISNSDLDSAQKSFEEPLKAFADQLAKSPKNAAPERQLILKSLVEKSNHAFEALVEYGRIVNAVSYRERYSSGTDAGAKCVKTQSGSTTAEALKGTLEACQPSP